MILSFRPIKIWPEGWDPLDTSRDPSPFTAEYRSTLDLLDRELHHLGASDVILQVNASERDCRLDGQLRTDAKVGHPGVILSFTSRVHGALSYPCDRYGKNWGSRLEAWQHNLRAIGLGLEALRKGERYGISERGQQYAGYREIGTGIALGAGMTREYAARLLGEAAGEPWEDILSGEVSVDACYKLAAKTMHPDVGGDSELMAQLTQARDLVAR